MARNLQVFKGLDRGMGGGHPLEEIVRTLMRLDAEQRQLSLFGNKE
jgi:hypothetical protein